MQMTQTEYAFAHPPTSRAPTLLTNLALITAQLAAAITVALFAFR